MRRILLLFLVVALLTPALSSCETSPSPTATSVQQTTTSLLPTEAPAPTDAVMPPTETPLPTDTPLPPTETPALTSTATSSPLPPTDTATPIPVPPTPLPPKPAPAPATHTVCAQGCDFVTIQAAIDSPETAAGGVIEITDAVHTEAAIIVNKDVTIRGLGAYNTIIQAHDEPSGATQRVFTIASGTAVVLQGLTIRHGRPLPKTEHGGGILNQGSLEIRDCIISGNTALGGGGVSSDGDLIIVESTITKNVARGDGPRGEECGGGGGIKARKGSLVILNSTISHNQAGTRSEGLGGGVRTGCGCTAEIVNSTISANKALRYGSGIAASGSVRIIHCTIADNSVGRSGGALWIRGQLSIENSIVARNRGGGDQCVLGGEGGHVGLGSMQEMLFTLIEDGSCGAELFGSTGMGSLSDNGGPTYTHSLLPDSPAIDTIPAAGCTVAVDQRGAPRPAFPVDGGEACDIGAFELQAIEPYQPLAQQ